MSNKIPVTMLKPITEVTRVYSGRPGCACGCRGTYHESGRTVKQVYNKFLANIQHVYTWQGHENEFAVLDISPSRTYTIHYT